MLSSCILSYGPFDVQPDTLGHCFINEMEMHSRGVIRQGADIPYNISRVKNYTSSNKERYLTIFHEFASRAKLEGNGAAFFLATGGTVVDAS